MYKMKTYKYAIALICAIGMMLISCGEDFLYKAPQGSVSKETLSTQEGADMIVTAAYGYLTTTGWGRTPFNWVFGGIYGGDANKGTDAGDQPPINDFEQFKVTSANDYVAEKFSWTFRGSQRVRVALQHLDEVEGLDPAFVSLRKGELYFLRALYYFEGLKVFGPYIPYVDETNIDPNPKVYNNEDIYPYVLEDAQKAIDLLPNKPDDVGRAYKYAAMALKAKILMQQPGMPGKAEAKTLLENVLKNGSTAFGKPYGLNPSLDFNWNCDNDNASEESIFEFQFSTEVTNNANAGMSLCYPYDQGPGGCCGFYQPSYELVNSFKVDENGLPYLDGSYRTRQIPEGTNTSISWFNMVPGVDDKGKEIKIFTLFNSDEQLVDPRVDFSVGRDMIPYKDWGICDALTWVRDFENGGIFNPKKHVYHAKEEGGRGRANLHDGWAPGSSMNIQYLSVRDAMLLLAELYADDGNLSGAMDLVNQIRKRAGNEVNLIKYSQKDLDDPKLKPELKAKLKVGDLAANYLVKEYPTTHAAYSDKNTCIAAVRMERKLELAMEGQRWFDLVRYGGPVMNQEITAYLDYEQVRITKFSGSTRLESTKTTIPMPLGQIQTMGKDAEGNWYLMQHSPWEGEQPN